MADGDFGASYDDVRDINKLDSAAVPDEVLDKHLTRALKEVERLLKTSFQSTQPAFTDTVFHTKDLFDGKYGSILYFSDFEDYNYLLSITSVSYRSTDSDDYTELTEGMSEDYSIDTRDELVKFNSFLARDGYNNLKASGTYGYTIANMPEWIEQFIAIIAALQGVVYASGGSYTDVKTTTIGNVSIARGQYAANLKQQYQIVKDLLTQHTLAHGVRMERTSSSQI